MDGTRQVKFRGESLEITASGRSDEEPSTMNTAVNENHQQPTGQRKMEFLFSTPRRKILQSFEPYIPPHRRFQSTDQSMVDKPKQKVVRPSAPMSWCNSQCNNNSDYADSKSEYSAFCKNKDLFDGTSNNENVRSNQKISSESIDNFLDFKKNFALISNGNSEVEDNTNNTHLILERVIKLIDIHVNNGLKEILDGLYEQEYGESLPPELLSKWKFSITLKNDAQSLASNKKLSDSIKQVDELLTKIVPDHLELNRLGKAFWINVHVCKNISELWGIIMDANHLGRVEKLSVQMQKLYQHSKTPNNVVVSNSYYALFDGSWHRVKCLQCDGSTATVLFIDRGDEDTVAISRLHELDSQFCTLPAQAIRMALTGLDIFADFDELQSILINDLHEKSIYAEVDAVTENHLSVQLYINDNDETINFNEVIMDQMFKKLLNPKLHIESNNIVPARVYNLENGIYIQLDIPSFKYFNLLMEKAVEKISKEDYQCQVVVKYEINKTYFVKSNEDQKWYRGKMIKFTNENEVEVVLIDVGSTTNANRKNIVSLEKVCSILAKYPAQAIEVQLDHIPLPTSNILSSLQNVISRNRILYVKFVTVGDNNNISTVQLLKKTENDFLSINNALMILGEAIPSRKDDSAVVTHPEISTTDKMQLKKSSADSKMDLAVRQKVVLTIDRKKISKIREMYKNPVDSGKYMNMCLSSILRAPKVPENDTYFDVHVVMSSDPSHFVVQLLREKTLAFNKMIRKMSESCRSYQGPTLTFESIKVGQVYACKSSENNNRDWCRAYVTEIRDQKTVSVYCCDYGSYKNVDISDMVPLENEFYRLPYQAIWAELNGVKPTSKEWTVRACLKFQELTQSKNFVSRVISKKDAKSKTLAKPTKVPVTVEIIYSIDLIDTSTTEDIDIANVLINEEMAERS